MRQNTSSLEQSDLTDERLQEDLCGLVYSLISIPTSQFQAQWDLFFSQKTAELEQATDDYEAHTLVEQQRILEATNDFVQAVIDAENQLQLSLAGFEQQWNDWFANQQTEGFVLASEKGVAGGVAKQDDFDEHVSDIVRHISAVERTEWNNKIDGTEKGEPEGVATLDGDGKIPSAQISENKGYVTGSYVGNGTTANRLISVGFAPSFVHIQEDTFAESNNVSKNFFLLPFGNTSSIWVGGASSNARGQFMNRGITNSGFYVSINSSSGYYSNNNNGKTYQYIAFK